MKIGSFPYVLNKRRRKEKNPRLVFSIFTGRILVKYLFSGQLRAKLNR